jgi:hypothetical protein
VFLTSSLNNVNQYCYATMCISSGLTRRSWDRILVKLIFSFVLCSFHVVNLDCTKFLYFPKIYNRSGTSLYCPVASGTSVDPTSQVWVSTMLVLLFVGNWKVWFCGRPNGITFIPNFIHICPVILELNHMGRQTYGRPDVHSFYICHGKNT